MRNLWKYASVAVIAFILGSAAVVTAEPKIKEFAISNQDGTHIAEVSDQGRLLVDSVGEVRVSNFPAESALPDPSTIVNLTGFPQSGPGQPENCDPSQGGFEFSVPVGKALLITDIVAAEGGAGLWTDTNGVIFNGGPGQFITPLKVGAGATLCPYASPAFPFGNNIFVSAQLVDVP
jgi:hypothetical protein